LVAFAFSTDDTAAPAETTPTTLSAKEPIPRTPSAATVVNRGRRMTERDKRNLQIAAGPRS
jgi:hypothetical protein